MEGLNFNLKDILFIVFVLINNFIIIIILNTSDSVSCFLTKSIIPSIKGNPSLVCQPHLHLFSGDFSLMALP